MNVPFIQEYFYTSGLIKPMGMQRFMEIVVWTQSCLIN